MCCFLATLLLIGPRAGILVWWIIDTARWTAAFTGSFIWPLLGFIFAPWTTLAYVLVYPDGLVMFDWIILGLAPGNVSMYSRAATVSPVAARRTLRRSR